MPRRDGLEALPPTLLCCAVLTVGYRTADFVREPCLQQNVNGEETVKQ